ncbi:MAG TPA: hypothetical protein VLA68_03805 [Nitrososphaera sp.]|nr:hypothetical protein [Nitrososphaera sp.]
MKKRKQANRIITYAGIGAIAAVVGFMGYLQVEASRNNEFKKSIDMIAADTIALTKEYQLEEGKWKNNEYDNSTMIAIVDRYQPRYQELIERAESLETPDRYKAAKAFLIKSVESEKESNEHFKNYLLTGDPEEYEKVVDLTSLSLQYGAEYDAAMNAAG